MVIIWILLNFLLYYVLFAAMKVAVFSAFWQKFICSKFAVQSVHQCAKQVKNVQKCACVQFDIYLKYNDLSSYVSPISIRKSIIYVLIFAERRGFEPLIRFRRIHAFQACLFNHSSTSPCVCGCKGNTLM